jgi:hypothetical protein
MNVHLKTQDFATVTESELVSALRDQFKNAAALDRILKKRAPTDVLNVPVACPARAALGGREELPEWEPDG